MVSRGISLPNIENCCGFPTTTTSVSKKQNCLAIYNYLAWRLFLASQIDLRDSWEETIKTYYGLTVACMWSVHKTKIRSVYYCWIEKLQIPSEKRIKLGTKVIKHIWSCTGTWSIGFFTNLVWQPWDTPQKSIKVSRTSYILSQTKLEMSNRTDILLIQVEHTYTVYFHSLCSLQIIELSPFIGFWTFWQPSPPCSNMTFWYICRPSQRVTYTVGFS